ncbi:MAG: HIT family protein [Flavobacteriaceae bacterium]|nr:HIT family protein [Flavobacteriaceae bacterium]
MTSIFSRIIERELPAYIVAEDDHHIAFLDINPNALGHTLCVPKKEVDKLFDLDDDSYLNLMHFSHRVATALRQVVSCQRVGLLVIGLEVPHVHVHLIPLNDMADATFKKKVAPSKEEMQTLTQQISTAFKQ